MRQFYQRWTMSSRQLCRRCN